MEEQKKALPIHLLQMIRGKEETLDFGMASLESAVAEIGESFWSNIMQTFHCIALSCSSMRQATAALTQFPFGLKVLQTHH